MTEIKSYKITIDGQGFEYREAVQNPGSSIYNISVNFVEYPNEPTIGQGKTPQEALNNGIQKLLDYSIELLNCLHGKI